MRSSQYGGLRKPSSKPGQQEFRKPSTRSPIGEAMTDPISVTLATITLATALKDLIELGRKVYESFKKPTLNMRAAEYLAAETIEIVNSLKEFYDGHEDILNTAPGMREAVLKLLEDMNVVYHKCESIAQPSSPFGGKFHRIKCIIDAWRNGKRLEIYIRNLRDRANKCYIQFMMFAVMRIEAATLQIRGALAHGVARHGLAMASPLRVSDDNILAFVGSTPTILSYLPPHVHLSEDLAFKSYVSLQVGRIDAMIKHLAAMGSYPIEEPDSLHMRPFRPNITLTLREQEEIDCVQDNVVFLLMKIQEHLKTGNDRLSIQQGAWAMSTLTVWLLQLAMSPESLTISLRVVDLYRILVQINPDIYTPHLVNALHVLSISFVEVDDIVPAHKFIVEGVALGRSFADSTPSNFEAQFQTACLISYSGTVARLAGDDINATHNAEEATQTFERLIGNNVHSMPSKEVGVSVEGERLLGRIVMSYETTHICYIADSLAELHYSLSLTARKDESVEAGLKALELCNALQEQFDNPKIHHWIAGICLSLASNAFRAVIPLTQALSYAQQSVKYYERILKTTGVFSETLPVALTTEAEILSQLGRFDEVYAVCQKTTKMVQDLVEDQRLRAHSMHLVLPNLFYSKRYEEAIIAGENLLATYRSLLSQSERAITYTYLSISFASIGELSQAIEAGEASVIQCRALALRAKQNIPWVARGLLRLAYMLSCSKDHERAFKAGHEGLALCSSLDTGDPCFLAQYQEGLQVNMDISMAAKTESMSLERSRDVVQRGRMLVKEFPNLQIFLLRLVIDHVTLLQEFGHLIEAGASIEEVLGWFELSSPQDADSAALYTLFLLRHAGVLFAQGRLDTVPGLYKKVIEIGQPFVLDYIFISNIRTAKINNALVLYTLGQMSLALLEIEECIKCFKCESSKDPVYIWCMDVASLIYRSSGKVDDALLTIRLSVDENQDHGQTMSSSIFSDLLADVGQDAAALKVAEEAVEEINKEVVYSIQQERRRKEAQYSLALRLFVNGDLPRARDLIVDVRSFYERHAEVRRMWFVSLAISLRAEGIFKCASDKHEEGIVARAKLQDLQERLQLVSPGLANLVRVGLDREKKFAAWRKIFDKCRLACDHQDEDLQDEEAKPAPARPLTQI